MKDKLEEGNEITAHSVQDSTAINPNLIETK